MAPYVQLLSVATPGSSPSVLIGTDHERYLFQVGEGTQRLCTEHKVRLSKIDQIFITHYSADTIGGLPGMILTLSDMGAKAALTLHGPPGVRRFLSSTRHFMMRSEFKITPEESTTPFKTKEVCITKLLIGAPTTPAAPEPPPQEESIPESPGGNGRPAKRQRVPWQAPPVGPPTPTCCLCYVAETPSVPGKFDVEKANELGIPRGQLYGVLKNGRPVTLSCGTIIQPNQVVGPAAQGGAVAIVACPTLELLTALVEHKGWKEWREKKSDERLTLQLMIHTAPSAILETSTYKQWCVSFGPGVCHVTASQDYCVQNTPFQAALLQSRRLHRVCPDVFPVPHQFTRRAGNIEINSNENIHSPTRSPNRIPNGSPLRNGRRNSFSEEEGDVPSSIVKELDFGEGIVAKIGAPLMRYWLAPCVKNGLDMSQALSGETFLRSKERALSGSWKDFVDQGVDSHLAALAKVRTEVEATNIAEHGCEAAKLLAGEPGAEIVFLGTGSAQPSTYRNVSGIYFKLGDGSKGTDAGMIMDAGEGTWGQIWRTFGCERAYSILRGLRAIWISHPHADHHLGLLRLLAERAALNMPPETPPLLIMAPACVGRWIAEYSGVDGGLDKAMYEFVDCADMMKEEGPHPKAALLREELGLDRCWNIPVPHCQSSYALLMRSIRGWKLVYSGDTRPCKELVEAGKGATILIHEATFDESMQQKAIARRHCTTSEAVEVGAKMGAHRTILTHFSQRYPKLPVLPVANGDKLLGGGGVCVAFDSMRLQFPALAWTPALLPALQCIFPPELDEEDDMTDGEAKAKGKQ